MFVATLERERKQLYNKGEAAGLVLGMQVQRQTIYSVFAWIRSIKSYAFHCSR